MEDFEGAVSDYNRALQINPTDYEAYYGRGFSKSKLNDQRSAIQDLTRAVEINNSFTNDAKKISYVGPINRGVLDNLRSVVQERIKINELSSERAEAYFIRGLSKSKSGDSKGAILDMNSAIELNPTYSEAYFSRGLVHSSTGDQMSAILDCSNAIKLRPNYPESYYVRGIIKHSLGDVNGGCLDLSKAGELGYTPSYKVISDYCN